MSYYEPRHEPFYDYRLMVLWILSSQDRNTHYEARSEALYKSVNITSLEKKFRVDQSVYLSLICVLYLLFHLTSPFQPQIRNPFVI